MPTHPRHFLAPLLPTCCAALLAVAVVGQAPAVSAPPAAMLSIGRTELMAHARLLASDELGGRLTGSLGQIAAAKYIAGHFAWLGLEPLGDEQGGGRSYFQHYGITRTYVTPASRLRFGEVEVDAGYAILGARPLRVELEGELRFLGLGQTRGSKSLLADEERLDGQVPVVVVKPPKGAVDKPLSAEQKFGIAFFAFSRLTGIAKALQKKGADAVVFALLDDRFGFSDVLNTLALAPGKDGMAPRFEGADNTMGQVTTMFGGGSGVPVIFLSVERSQAVLQLLGVATAAVRAAMAGDGDMPAGRRQLPVVLDLEVIRDADATACNVVAVLRGSDPKLAAEAVVYSAHMDHVGRRLDGEVFNGADDNASGSAGLMAIAGAFARSATRPRRSIIFLSVSGEELGLWGSAYYAEQPTWPAELLIADINTDMIGRSGPESGPTEVTVTPSHRHQMFSTLVQRAAACAAELGMTFAIGDKYYMRSDHYNFAKKGIPVVFFCNGEHEDYHQVSDHAAKLDAQKLERIARLAFWTGWGVANDDERPVTLGRQQEWR